MVSTGQALKMARLNDNDLLDVGDFSQIKPPSKRRYFGTIIFAVIGDIIDIFGGIFVALGFVAGGVPGLVVWLIEIAFETVFIDVPILMLIGRKRDKENSKFIEKAADATYKLRNKITFYRNSYARFLRMARKTKLLRKPVTSAALKFMRFRSKIMSRKIVGRMTLRIILDKIKYIDFWPWRTFGVRKSYKNALENYKNALELKDLYEETVAEFTEARNDAIKAGQAAQEEEEEEEEEFQKAA